MPDGSAYQHVTATLDLALPGEHNLHVANDLGELLTTAKLPIPSRSSPRQRGAPAGPESQLALARRSSRPAASTLIANPEPTHLGKRCACGNPTRLPVNDVAAVLSQPPT